MKAWNYAKNDCDQETSKEYSTIVLIIVKDDRGKAIAWLSISCKVTCYHVWEEKKSINSQSAFCTRPAVCSLHFVLSERASSPDRNVGARKKILVTLSWLLWFICGLYVDELTRKSTIIKQWLLYTNWRRTQMRGLPIWRPLTLFRVVTACVEMNLLRVP